MDKWLILSLAYDETQFRTFEAEKKVIEIAEIHGVKVQRTVSGGGCSFSIMLLTTPEKALEIMNLAKVVVIVMQEVNLDVGHTFISSMNKTVWTPFKGKEDDKAE